MSRLPRRFHRLQRHSRLQRPAVVGALVVSLVASLPLAITFGVIHAWPTTPTTHAAAAALATATIAPTYSFKPTIKLNQDCDFQATALTVKISGSNFQANESVAITFDTTTMATLTADAAGTFTKIPVALPTNPATGPHTITATGQTSGDVATHAFDTQAGSYPAPINNGAKIKLTPYCQYAPESSGTVWFTTHLSGSGFTPGEGVAIYFDSTLITGVAANSTGHISDGDGESVSPGTHWYEAVGATSGHSSSAAIVVVAES